MAETIETSITVNVDGLRRQLARECEVLHQKLEELFDYCDLGRNNDYVEDVKQAYNEASHRVAWVMMLSMPDVEMFSDLSDEADRIPTFKVED